MHKDMLMPVVFYCFKDPGRKDKEKNYTFIAINAYLIRKSAMILQNLLDIPKIKRI